MDGWMYNCPTFLNETDTKHKSSLNKNIKYFIFRKDIRDLRRTFENKNCNNIYAVFVIE